jgi:uncharacterized protein YpbB
MAAVCFSTETYLRERQKAVYEASGFVPEELKTKPAKKASKTEKEAKPKKEDTRLTTFKLYRQGLSIDKIAKQRDLHKRTIHNHLAHYVAKGMLPVEDFVPASRCETIRSVIAETGTLKGLAHIKQSCPDDISYEDIIMVVASMEV